MQVTSQEVVTYLASLKSYKKLERKWKIRILHPKGEHTMRAQEIMDTRKWNDFKKQKL